MAQFTPTMGNVFTQDFENTNPFWQFIPGQNGNGAGPNAGSFVSITPAALNTAAGLVMPHVQSGIGWIAAANTTSHMSTSSSSSLFTASVTHKETANTAPVWTAVLPDRIQKSPAKLAVFASMTVKALIFATPTVHWGHLWPQRTSPPLP
jgi:hypothetical protein